MGGLVVDCGQSDVKNLTHYGEWVRLDDYLNIRPFDLRIHTTHGECWAALPFDNCLYKIEDGKIAETFRIDFGEKWYSGKKLKTND